MAPKKRTNIKNSYKPKAKESIKAPSSSSPFTFEVVETSLPQTLPGDYPTNPYQYAGTIAAFEAKTVEEGFYVKVDMPGVEKETVKVEFKDKKLSFKGEAPTKNPLEAGPRNYSGEITFSLEPLEVSEVKDEYENGVLRLVLFGSGFPPNYNAVSSHAHRKVPQLTKDLMRGDADLATTIFKMLALDPPEQFVGKYPFQLDGPNWPYEMISVPDEYMFVRIDMPDVDKQGLVSKLSNQKFVFGGDGKAGFKYDDIIRRQYVGHVPMFCDCCKLGGMEKEITDGVMRVLLKKETAKPHKIIWHLSEPKKIE